MKRNIAPLVILVLLSAGCVDVEPEPIDYGPQSDIASLNAAIKEIQPKKTLLDIKEGEYVQKTTFIIVGTGTAVTNQVTGAKVLRRTVDESSLKLTLLQETKKYQNDDVQTFTREHFEAIPLKEIAALKTQSGKTLNLKSPADGSDAEDVIASLSPMQNLVQKFQGTLEGAKKLPILTIHNLKVTDHTIPAPKLISKADNCRGLENCQLKIKQMKVDLVATDDKGEREKTSFTQWTTSDTPYLAAMLLDCQEISLRIEGRSVLLKQCHAVDDFMWGGQQ